MEKEKLSSVIEVLESGARPKGGAVEFQADTIPSLGAEHLNDFGGFKFDKVKFVPKSFFNDMTKGIITRGDILVVKDGATTGKVSLVDDSFPFEKAAINEHVFLLRVAKNKAFNGYVFHFLKSPIGQIEIQKDFRGATVGGISRRFIDLIKLPFPPISDQIRIANILSKAEALISQRKESLRLLDELLKSTFLEMFGDPVRNEKGWDTKTIEALVKKEKYSLKRGPFGGALKKNIFVSDGYLVYEQYHALNNDFTFERYYIDETKFQELKAFEVKSGDIIISCSGVYLGKLAIVPNGTKRGIINQALLKLSLDNRVVNSIYFVFLFRHESFRNNFFGNTRGSGIPNFPPMEAFKKFNFIYPPLKRQTQFAHIVEKTEGLKVHYQTSLRELENLYGSLSQRAFSPSFAEASAGEGELSIKEGESSLAMAAEPEEVYKTKKK